MNSPKVFISYSWSSPGHQEMVKEWADRLIHDGVDVIIDIYDLSHGDDKYVFMESMVNDTSVTHVLVVCDSSYATKADARASGVGTETQIISAELYKSVTQSKFIPLICELTEDGEPILPTFMQNRIGINFSSAEYVNKNWEELIRRLYGKPQHIKPKKGIPPSFLTEDTGHPPIEASGKFRLFQQAIQTQKSGITGYRKDFLRSCVSYIDSFRIREQPELESFPEKVHNDCLQMKVVRNLLCDWLTVECEFSNDDNLSETLINFLEKVVRLKERPEGLNPYNTSWFEAHSMFAYELFLYFISKLIENEKYIILNRIYLSNYLTSDSNDYGEPNFKRFDCFWGTSDFLQKILAPEGQRLYSPAAEYIKQNSDRPDTPFPDIMQAELLTLLMSFLSPETYWYPQTLIYGGHQHSFPFFIKATRKKDFQNLVTVTGIETVEELKKLAEEGQARMRISGWGHLSFHRSFTTRMNMNKLDTLS